MEASTKFTVSPPHNFTYGKIYSIKWLIDTPTIELGTSCEIIKTSESTTGMHTVEFKTTSSEIISKLETVLEHLRVSFAGIKELKRYGKSEKCTVYF